MTQSSLPQIMAQVIDLFGRHRLLTFDRDPVTRAPTVEVAHEALFREWGRLESWLDDYREDIYQTTAFGIGGGRVVSRGSRG